MFRLLAPVLLLLLLCGCAGPELSSVLQVAQYGTTTFTHGSMETVTAHPFDQVTKAVRTMVEELDLTVRVDRPQHGFLYLDIRDQQNTSIMVRVLRRTRTITSVKVQVGMFGDQPYSTAIMGRIAEVLKRSADKARDGQQPDAATDP